MVVTATVRVGDCLEHDHPLQHHERQQHQHQHHKGSESLELSTHCHHNYIRDSTFTTTILINNMAEGSSKDGESPNAQQLCDGNNMNIRQSSSFSSSASIQIPSSTSRPKPKLGRSSTLTWFNKSFDQAALRPDRKSPQRRQMRRQSSVTDFFQYMLSKSKSHIVGILSNKKEKSEKRMDAAFHRQKISGSEAGAIGGSSSEPLRVPKTSIELSLKSESKQSDTVVREPFQYETEIFHAPKDASRPKENVDLINSISADSGASMNSSSPVANFIVKKTLDPDQSGQARSFENSSSCQSSLIYTGKLSPSISVPSVIESQYAIHRKTSLHSQSSMEKQMTANEMKDDTPMTQRLVSSAPPVRPHNLMVRDATTLFKRTLVKSSSETFAKESINHQPLIKASSDGNCCKTGGSLLSLGPQNTVITSITTYLFLGSIEAAYSEPILCKYKITALVDMTNLPSTDVPLHKKTDCPCACVSKNHFRSKLNIGVDDIEWENLEQYYDEINAFINGARKKGGRILIFSYMGQSRAAAATIQHLMSQFRIPFNEAYHIIKCKRPQTKMNSGFVKALCRFEKSLGLSNKDEFGRKQKHSKLSRQRSEDVTMSARVSRLGEDSSDLAFPYVVKGAWLEC